MVSPIRFSGIASGMDTDSMVKELMKAQKAPLNKLLQQKQWDSWKRDTYREMNTLLLNFRNITSDMKLQGTFLKKTVVSENEAALTAKNISNPQMTGYSVQVNKLAVAGTPSSAKFTNSLADESTKINSAFDLKVGTETISVTADDTIATVVKKVNALTSKTGVTVSYMSGDKSLTFTSTAVGAAGSVAVSASTSNPLGIGSHSISSSAGITLPINTATDNTLTFNGINITLDANIYDGSGPGKNLSDFAKAIQNKIDTDPALADLKNKGLQVNAYGDKLTFTANEAITVGSSSLQAKLNLSTGTFGTGPIQNGKDVQKGEVVINGTTMAISSNTFTYGGVEYTAKQVTTTPVNVNVKPDEDAVFDKIKNFVDEYNKLIDTLNKKIEEPKYRDYKPLLDEEKEAMSEKQIELWEEKAKSGVLNRDSNLTKVLNDMRRSLYTKVEGTGIDTKFDTLSEIGITAGDTNNPFAYQEKGKLYIDEDKLRTAIRENGEKVMDLFTKTPTATEDPDKYKQSGIMQRLYTQLDDTIDIITDVAGNSTMADTSEYFTMGKSMRNLNKEIDRWEDRLLQIEERYWKQFNAMEQAINSANSQSAWLTQQLG